MIVISSCISHLTCKVAKSENISVIVKFVTLKYCHNSMKVMRLSIRCSWQRNIIPMWTGMIRKHRRNSRLSLRLTRYIVWYMCSVHVNFYRAMHFSAKRGIAIVYCPSVCLSVCLSVTFRYRDHIGWNSSKIITWPNSLRPLLGLTPTWAIWCNGNTPKIGAE